MKKIKIGLFSLFALTVGGATVITVVPQTASAKPFLKFPWNKWVHQVWDTLSDIVGQVIDILIPAKSIHSAPNQGYVNVEADLSRLLEMEGMIADYSDNGASLSKDLLMLKGDLVLENGGERVVVLKAGSYKIDSRGMTKLTIDVFKPSPTFPEAPGTLIFK